MIFHAACPVRVSQKVSGMEYDACATCVSRDRRQTPMKSLAHVCNSLLGELRIPESAKICWECEFFLKKCLKFQSQAWQAQEIFSDKLGDLTDVQSLSKLRVYKKDYFDSIILYDQNDDSTNVEQDNLYFSRDDILQNINSVTSMEHNYLKLEKTDDVKNEIQSVIAEEQISQDGGYDGIVASKVIKVVGKGPKCVTLNEVQPKQWLQIKTGNKVKKVPVFGIKGVQNLPGMQKIVSKKLSSLEEHEIVKSETCVQKPVRKLKKKRLTEKKTKCIASTRKHRTSISKTDNMYFKTVVIGEVEMRALRAEEAERPQYIISAFKCERCVVGYYSEAQLQDHIKCKHTSKPGHVECPVCGVRVAADSLRAHRLNHYTLFQCRLCPFRHALSRHMWSHARSAHTAQEYTCPYCNATFNTYKRRRYHVETRHPAQTVSCEFCGKAYRNLAILKTHIKNTHGDRERVPCPVCAKLYLGEANMRAHLRLAHRSAPAPPPRCDACAVTFKNKETYKMHLKTSLNHVSPDQMRFACSSCDKRFALKRSLQDHQETHHSSKTHACMQCDKVYASVRALRYHERRAHSDVQRVRDKVCEACGKGFYTAKALRVHVGIHSEERPFVCKICAASFRFYSAIYKHNQLKHKAVKSDRDATST